MKSTRRCRSANEAGLYAETLPARGAKALGEVMLAEIGVIEEEMHVDRWFSLAGWCLVKMLVEFVPDAGRWDRQHQWDLLPRTWPCLWGLNFPSDQGDEPS